MEHEAGRGTGMRVLLISRAMVAASHRARLRELARLGVGLTLLAPHRWEYQYFEPGVGDGYETLVTPARLAWPALGRVAHHTFYYANVTSVLTREKWDLVHVDDEPFNFATYNAIRSMRRNDPPVVFTTWQNLMKAYPPPFSLFERRVFARAAGAIAGNPHALDVLRRRGFSKPAAVIPLHGVDPAIYRKQEVASLRQELELEDAFAVGYVGRFSPEKGLDTLLEAMALLPRNCVLVLVGSGPERLRLESRVQSLGLSKRVRWIPWAISGEVPLYMNAFDVLVLPSRTLPSIREQFGRVLVESMACETCVVGSDSGEIPKVIADAGLIFQEGDERELAERLRKLMEDSLLRETLGRQGRERVLQHYTHERIAQKTVSFYQRVCGQGGEKAPHDFLTVLVEAPGSTPL